MGVMRAYFDFFFFSGACVSSRDNKHGQLEVMQTTLEAQATEFEAKLQQAEQERQRLMQTLADGQAAKQRHFALLLEESRLKADKHQQEAQAAAHRSQVRWPSVVRQRDSLACFVPYQLVDG